MQRNGRKRVTLGEVAAAAGLSPAAVSRYLSGSLALPETTGRRIEAAIRELGYRPNHHARSLSRGRSDAIGLVISDIDNPFFSKLAAAVEQAADERGIAVMLCSTSNRLERELRYIRTLGVGVVDGLLFATNHHDGDGALAQAINESARVVLIDEDVPGADVSKIFSDNRQGGYLAGRHLIEAGHRRLAYIGGPCDLMSARERAEGLHRAVAEAGADAAVVAERFGAYAIAFGAAAIGDLLDGPARPSAVFAGNDEILIGLLQVLAARGVAVGRDLSVVTFDDAGPLELIAPPITAIRQPIEDIGKKALDLLLQSIEGGVPARTERLPVRLIERRSVAQIV
ncbi:LacI family DNA-binding transcriptional regulator [Jiella sp. M17.18]|uniref:LacI family DNA-binding transcriptional regulator n=1 Tax=Jiella sp. M17.18 TaxID=3234247 RepID=UPI0034DDEF3E